MISDSPSAYLFIRVAILLLRVLAPLSVLYCVLRIIKPAYNPLPLPISIIAYAETAFYFFVYLPRSYILQRPAPTGTKLSQQQRNDLFEKCLDTVPDMDYFLNVWFKGADVSDLRRGDIEECLAWAFFNEDEVSSCDKNEVDDYVTKIEIRLGRQFPYGRSTHKGMRPTIDPINMQHRGLLYYLVSSTPFGLDLSNLESHRRSIC
jgi:hypothetical protein